MSKNNICSNQAGRIRPETALALPDLGQSTLAQHKL